MKNELNGKVKQAIIENAFIGSVEKTGRATLTLETIARTLTSDGWDVKVATANLGVTASGRVKFSQSMTATDGNREIIIPATMSRKVFAACQKIADVYGWDYK